MSEAAIALDVERLLANVPACLRERPQWVGWSYVQRDGRATKCPIRPTKGGMASSVNPATWGTFEQALAACRNCPDLAGVGFVFTADDAYAGVDLDDCIDGEGHIKPWAMEFLQELDSYSEISPSGRGVKVFVQAQKAGSKCRKPYADGQVEMYDHGRFFTVTGQRLEQYSAAVQPRQDAFDAVYAKVIGEAVSTGVGVGASASPSAELPTAVPAAPSAPPPAEEPAVALSDDDILRLAGRSRRSGEKFTALWAGRWNDYFNSRSEADSSVVFTLAFYTKDACQIDRLYRQSGLMRDKWDEQHGDATYGELTIAKALSTVTGQYRPRKSPRNGVSKATRSPPGPPASTGRPQVQGNERQLRDIRNDALSAVYAANSPPRLFARGGGIARVVLVEKGEESSGSNGTCGGVPCVQHLDADALRGELTNVADWFMLRHGKEGDALVPELPPLAIARDILAQPSFDLPPLAGVITCPTFAPDGSLITANGYHASSGLWLHSSITDLPPVATRPDADAVAAARAELLEVIADFPFVDDASRANAVALMLLPFVRPMIAGPTPVHGVDAPSPASGKDLLVKSSLWAALGYEVGATTSAKDPDEWRKKITSALAGGSPAILWGNVARRLDSEHLAAVLTDVMWRDRQLGQTKELSLPNRAVWAATGNNLAFSREMARRVVWIRLDAKMESPEQRTGFRHPNLLAYVREHRTRLVHAALTLVRAWLAAGRPAGKQIMGSFESYAAVMGGILDVAGIPGFLANGEELRRHADAETGEWRAFVQAWWERWHGNPVGVRDLATLLWEEGGQRTDLLLSVVTAPTERGAVTQLGMRLSRKRECVIGAYRIMPADPDKSGRQQYYLAPVDGIPLSTKCEGMPKVCQRYAASNDSNSKDLQESAYLGIPFCPSPNACVYARTRVTHAQCDLGGRPPERYAKVCQSPQPQAESEVKSADLSAYLRHTLPESPKRYADGQPPTCEYAWYAANGEDLPPAVKELAAEHKGWRPRDWHNRLLQLAERCEHVVPDRAAELRQAAALMKPAEPRHAP